MRPFPSHIFTSMCHGIDNVVELIADPPRSDSGVMSGHPAAPMEAGARRPPNRSPVEPAKIFSKIPRSCPSPNPKQSACLTISPASYTPIPHILVHHGLQTVRSHSQSCYQAEGFDPGCAKTKLRLRTSCETNRHKSCQNSCCTCSATANPWCQDH